MAGGGASGDGRAQRGQEGRKAVVAGGTGLVGIELVKLLLDDPRYARVVALTRRPGAIPPHPKLEERVVAYDRLEEALAGAAGDALRDADVFCALGTTIRQAGSQEAFRQVDYAYPLALGRLAKASGAAQLLIVTAMGADPRSRIFYSRVKGDAEQALCGLGLPRLHIFRPSLLLGERQEVRAGERLAAALAPLWSAALRGPLRKYKPIAGRAVAMAMVHAAVSEEAGGAAAAGAGDAIVYTSDRIAELAQRYAR